MPPPAPRHAFCETVTAAALAPWHIRALAPDEALRPGGGLTGPALCGRSLRGGWDIPSVPVTETEVDGLAGTDPVGVCPRCAAALTAAHDTGL